MEKHAKPAVIQSRVFQFYLYFQNTILNHVERGFSTMSNLKKSKNEKETSNQMQFSDCTVYN